jgi:hypothetical protein
MKNFILTIALVIVVLFSKSTNSQTGFISGLPDGLSIGGYVDFYIGYDNDKSGTLRQFSSIAPYRDEFKLNLAQIYARYTGEKVRGNVVLHYGDIPKLNWPEDQKIIQEANIGVQPIKNLWIDGGYFLTHIGGEGIIPKYNYFTSLSLCTYYEPFYQSGIRISHSHSDKFYFAFHLVNGYNMFTDNNKNKSFGITLGVKPSKKVEVTFNNLIGNEMPTGLPGKTRVYNNVVVKLNLLKKLDMIICTDYCFQEKSKITDSTASATLFSGFVSMKYKICNTFSAALRGETYNDKDGILSGVYNPISADAEGLKANGVTFGIEYNPVDNAYVRLESRYLTAKKKIFYDGTNTTDSRFEAILSSGIEF